MNEIGTTPLVAVYIAGFAVSFIIATLAQAMRFIRRSASGRVQWD